MRLTAITRRRFTALVALAISAVLAIAILSHTTQLTGASTTHSSSTLTACNGDYPGVCAPDEGPANGGDSGNIIDE